MTEQYKYYAFISYSHKDSKFAKWMQSELEHYKLPATLNGRPGVPETFRPIFRDEDELSGGDLKPQIIAALEKSANLIVVCSQNSANSIYVDAEIREFIEAGRLKGVDNRKNIYPIIISGVPYSEDKETECFPCALKELSNEGIEPIAGDATKTGWNHAFVKVLAGTLRKCQIDFDELWNRYEREKQEQERKRRIRRRIAISTLVLLLIAAIGLSCFFYFQRRELQINRSKAVAEKAIQLVEEGDSYTACLLALEVLPENLENPFGRAYTPEAESALRMATMKENGVFIGHSERINSLAFSTDGKLLVSGSDDGSIRIWDILTGRQIREPLYGTEYFNWRKSVKYVSFCPGNRSVVAVSDSVQIWDVISGKQINKAWKTPSFSSIGHCSISQDYKRIAFPCTDKTVRVMDLKTGKQIGESLTGHAENLISVSFSHDGKRIASTSFENTIRIWDIETGKQIDPPLEGHTNYANSVAFSPNNQLIVSGSSWESNLRIWDTQTHNQIGESLIEHTKSILSVSFSPDGKSIVSASADSTIRIWDLTKEKPACKTLKAADCVTFATFSPDGKRIASATSDNKIRLWDLTDKSRLNSQEIAGSGKFYALSPDGKTVVSASNDNDLVLWDLASGKQKGIWLEGHSESINSISFSPDGKQLVSASRDGTIRMWDISSEKQVGESLKKLVYSHFLTVSFSADGKYLVSTSVNQGVSLWSAKTKKQIGKPIKCDSYASALSHDGKIIISGNNEDHSIRIWNASTGKQIGNPLIGHFSYINSLSFSPDDKYIVSASWDGTIRIWNAATGKQIGNSLEGAGESRGHATVSFSPDGRHIIAIYEYGTILSWEWKPLQELINETRERFKDRKLTLEERRKYYLE